MTTYNATEVAKLCGVSKRTVQRRAAELEAHGAWRDSSGEWNISIEAMLGAGFQPGRPSRPDAVSRATTRQPLAQPRATTRQTAAQPRGDILGRQGDRGDTGEGDTGDTGDKGQLEALRSEVTELRRRAEVAELAQIELREQAERVPDLLRRAEVAETAAAGWQRLVAAHERTILALEARPNASQTLPDAPSAPTPTDSSRTPRWPLLARLRRS